MENKYGEQFIITIEAKNQQMKSNKQDSDEKIMKLTEYFKTILAELTDQINTLK